MIYAARRSPCDSHKTQDTKMAAGDDRENDNPFVLCVRLTAGLP